MPPLNKLVQFGLRGGLAAALLYMVFTVYQPLDTGGEPVVLSLDVELVGHAGVGLPEGTYTNSLEALDMAVSRGFTLIELDLSLTSDDRIVASHDWDIFYVELHPGVSFLPSRFAKWIRPEVPTYDEFMGQEIRGGLTPLDVSRLSEWLTAHPAVKIVTDAKDDNLEILRSLMQTPGFPSQQLIPQIYNRDELAPVIALGFSEVIYTLYRDTTVAIADVATFARDNGVIVTMPASRASAENLRLLKSAGVRVFVHTINDVGDAETLYQRGITGLYTDFFISAAVN
jgi:glycerophosphoryl diester phosphodiesterase